MNSFQWNHILLSYFIKRKGSFHKYILYNYNLCLFLNLHLFKNYYIIRDLI